MRTTLTISDALDGRLRKVARAENRSYKDVVNDALARGIERLETAEAEPEYRVETGAFGLRPGIDPDNLNQLVDELETEAEPE